MDPQTPQISEVDAFVIAEIESVPHLEALLLIWNGRPRKWSVSDMARAIYLADNETQLILRDLVQRQLIVMESDMYRYNASHPKTDVVAKLDSIYRREIVRISNMIHSKPSASVRAFARAFKLTKD